MDKFKHLSSQLNNPVFYETGGNREFISENIFDLTGYYAEEIRMNRDLFPGLINPEDYIETNFRIKNWHKQNEPGVLTIQFRIHSAKGSQIWIEDHLIGLKIGDTKYMQGIMLNISENKIRQTELLQLRTEWNDNAEADEKEKEIVFKDIQRQLNELENQETNRKNTVTEILEYVREGMISFEKIAH